MYDHNLESVFVQVGVEHEQVERKVCSVKRSEGSELFTFARLIKLTSHTSCNSTKMVSQITQVKVIRLVHLVTLSVNL